MDLFPAGTLKEAYSDVCELDVNGEDDFDLEFGDLSVEAGLENRARRAVCTIR